MKHLHLKIFGEVQGVNFRWYARKEARRLGLSGWVKNMSDGTVEMVVEGEENKLKEFLNWCKVGPRGAVVSKAEEGWGEIGERFEDFKISFEE
ncbi:MAG: acylphosphatase [Candidatus Magasanikbacteria bacterium]|nr:acylphosphatase [Candidatus Magasanikbacteria bacterium]